MPADPNAGQRDYWNSVTGGTWRVNADALDTAFADVTARIVKLLDPRPGERILDIGCGSGATTLAAAHAVGETGAVAGVDISATLAANAGERIAAAGLRNAAVTVADAQTDRLGEGFDAAISRFGIMFFADPAAAFANIGAALRPGGRAVFAAWAALDANPWFVLPREAAVARMGDVPLGDPNEPGPFAFADPDRFAAALDAAGFVDIAIRRELVTLVHPGPLAEAARLLTTIGPASRVLRAREGTEADAEAVATAIAEAMAPYREGDGIAVPAVLNVGTARRP